MKKLPRENKKSPAICNKEYIKTYFVLPLKKFQTDIMTVIHPQWLKYRLLWYNGKINIGQHSHLHKIY